MKRIVVLCMVSAISIAVHADEDADRQRPPILKVKSDAQIAQEREKFFAELEAKRENLNDLERLAVPVGTRMAPRREDVLPYRFGDVSRLQAMLRDPEWINHWTQIAATIAMAADKKAALDLIEFIKDADAPAAYKHKWDNARVSAIGSLAHTLIGQDIPEVLGFLEKLATDDSYAKSLNLGMGQPGSAAQFRAYLALSAAATDDTIAVLERALAKESAEKERETVQALSVGGQPNDDRDDRTNESIRLLEMYIGDAKRERVGVRPEPSNEMP